MYSLQEQEGYLSCLSLVLYRLNRSCEALQNELMSKSAAERVLAKALEMQVRSLEKNMEQKVILIM